MLKFKFNHGSRRGPRGHNDRLTDYTSIMKGAALKLNYQLRSIAKLNSGKQLKQQFQAMANCI